MDENDIFSHVMNNSQEFLSKFGIDIEKPIDNSTNVIPTMTITNVVASMKLNCTLDLPKLSAQIRNSEYCPRLYTALIMRIKSPRATGLLFHSGSLIVAGGRTEEEIKLASRKLARIVMKAGYNVKIVNYRVVNVCGNCNFGAFIDLSSFARKHSAFCTLEFELFPALIYKLLEPKMTCIVFANGKVNVVGAKSTKLLMEGFEKFFMIVQEFIK